jgi:hypothetical protein
METVATRLLSDLAIHRDGHLHELGRFSSPKDPAEHIGLGRELRRHLAEVNHLSSGASMRQPRDKCNLNRL